MSCERQKRRQEIHRALSFIRSALPYPDPEAYEQGVVVQLVCDLLCEGNASFREGEWTQAQTHFTEGVRVALYARDEGLNVPVALLESLHINRAVAHQNMGEFESGVMDCDLALALCKDSPKALYRKAVCLKACGKLSEAYDCSAACLLISPQDKTVRDLAQELSVSLSLKNRNVYSSHISAVGLNHITVLDSVPDGHLRVSEPLEDNDVMGDELDSLLDSVSREQDTPQNAEVLSTALLSPRLPPAFFSSAGSRLNALDSFIRPGSESDSSRDALDALDSICPRPAGSVSLQRPLAVGGDMLDSLSEFSLPDGKQCHRFLPSNLQDHASASHARNSLSSRSKNPLEQTHDFTRACSTCFTSTGSGVLDFEFRCDLTHICKKDLLLCRRRGGANSPWRRIRSRPTHNNFRGAFMLCREVLENQVCKYGEDCTFASCQEEIDVWTQERRGLLIRELLFSPLETLSVITLLNIHAGTFMFLCQVCFDCKPRLISKRRKDSPALCANTQTQHQFDKTRCLVHVVKNTAVCYSKIRALTSRCQFHMCRHEISLGCQRQNDCCFSHSLIELYVWILQRQTGITAEEIVNESETHWNKQQPVNISSRSPNKTTAAKCKSPLKPEETNGKTGRGSADSTEVKGHGLEMKFVCAQCWRDGLLSEPDRTLKYCSAKARHGWTKDRRILLVKSQDRRKWVAVRPLPFAKSFLQQYDICVHVLKQRKCNYTGNCTFAHSEEERELWTYMKNNNLKDIQQVYDVWLSTANQKRPPDRTSLSTEEKQITMPTDFAEVTVDSFYCALCGKHSNSERQWLRHITSEKHKNRVFSGEGEDESLAWTHRFPGPSFSLCHRLEEGCPDGASCDFAHSEEELQEWCRRREFLRRWLNKARAEMLISPTDNDFGKYNYLLQD